MYIYIIMYIYIYIYLCVCVNYVIYIYTNYILYTYVCVIIPLMLIYSFRPLHRKKTGPFQEFRAFNDIFQGPMAWLCCSLMLRRQEGLELARVGRSQFPAIPSVTLGFQVGDQEVHRHGYMICMKYDEMYIYIYI